MGDADTADVTEANWELLMDINLKGMFLTIKHVLPVMRSRGSGVIINISSTASLCTRPTMLAYKTSKAAINAMTQKPRHRKMREIWGACECDFARSDGYTYGD